MLKNVISIIMGGGRGTRLYPLTKYRCKPAVPLAGKYRLVDIPISNCINSGCDEIYLLSQFNTASLHKHIQQTYKFDNFSRGFVDILAAEQTDSGGDWYQGTADAVRKNMHHFRRHGKDSYFLILSGDQLYQMDFRTLIEAHKKSGADITIAAKPMPKREAPSLGIMRVDENLNITEFVEKPKDPAVIDSLLIGDKLKSGLKNPNDEYCLASMGIYVFSQRILEEAMSGNEMDFGKEVIPGFLNGKKLCAFIFDGYWEDIGTVGAFFEANLATTDEVPPFDFYKPNMSVYTHSRFLPGAKICHCSVDHCNISDGVIIEDAVLKRCVIGVRSIIGQGSNLENVIMMGADEYPFGHENGTKIGVGKNCRIRNAIVDKNAYIGDNCVLSPDGKPDRWDAVEGLYVRDNVLIVTKDANIPPNTVV